MSPSPPQDTGTPSVMPFLLRVLPMSAETRVSWVTDLSLPLPCSPHCLGHVTVPRVHQQPHIYKQTPPTRSWSGVTPGCPLEPSHLTGPQQSSSLYPHTLPWSCAHGGLSRHPHGTESVESSLLQALWGPVSRAVPSPQAVPSRASQACAPRPAAASSSQPLLPPSCPSLPHGGALSRMQAQEENVFIPAFQT